VGKSRLLYEFANWGELIDEDFWQFEARATQTSMLQPFSLTRDLFSFRFQILDSDPLEVVHSKFIAGVADFLGSESADKAELIGQLVGFDFSAAPTVAEALKDGDAFRRRGLELLGEFFAAACATLPVVVHIEDIHWADDRSLDLINLLVRDNLKLPLFVLCMARPSLYERRPQWGEGQTFHERIALEPLSHLSARRLVRELLKKVADVPAALRDVVVERADGNPFYIEELVRVLIDDGVIVKGDPEWSVNETRLSGLRIPSTLTGVLQSRLDTLAPGLQQLLQRVSVVGRVFWDATAIALSRPGLAEDEVQAMLENLRRREMILRREESAFAGTVEYVFRHAILRDVTYETLVPRQRRALHRQVGDWLFEIGGERARENTLLVAEHYERAGESIRAAGQLLLAGQAAISVSAYDEAVATLSRARLLAAGEPGSAGRFEVEATLADVLSLQGDRAEAQRILEAVLPEARRSSHRLVLARILGILVRIAIWRENSVAARAWLDEALPLAREIGDEPSLMFILRQAGNLTSHDPPVAGPFLEESLTLARKLNDFRGEMTALNSLGNMHQFAGELDRARDRYEAAILCGEDRDPSLGSMARANLGALYTLMGRFAEAEQSLEAALKMTRQFHLPFDEADVHVIRGFLELRRGNDAAAEQSLRAAIGEFRKQNSLPAMLLLLFAVLESRHGDRRRALALLGLARSRPASQVLEIPLYIDLFLSEVRGDLSNEEAESLMNAGAALDFEGVFDEIAPREPA
ncbi:MAG: tetratricopeptide repeat protein, partial [Candidatus Eisenbacteria bacterium]